MNETESGHKAAARKAGEYAGEAKAHLERAQQYSVESWPRTRSAVLAEAQVNATLASMWATIATAGPNIILVNDLP